MGKTYDSVTPELQQWLARQRVFFVATAPLARDGHVNCSPKGGDAFRVLGPLEVAYHDFTGSGIETVAHLRENGRIVLMFCAFEGPPKILRLHGRGIVVEPGDDGFSELAALFPHDPGSRAIIRVAIDRISDSCGFGVPNFENPTPRDELTRWAETKGAAGLAVYRVKNNRASIDGLPGLRGS